MRKTAVLLLLLMFSVYALAEPALTVGNVTITDGEVRACACMAAESYRETVEYYAEYLGIDYWALEYPGGMTVEQCVASDVFRQLVLTCALCDLAGSNGIRLSSVDSERCKGEAAAWFDTLTEPSFTADDARGLYEKQLLAGRVYAVLVLATDVDPDKIICEPSVVYCTEYIHSITDADFSPDVFDNPESSEFTKSTMDITSAYPEEFISAVSALEPGEISDPIKTEYGLFMFKLTEIRSETYDEANARALYMAKEQAFAAELDRLYSEVSYTIHDSFRGAMALR